LNPFLTRNALILLALSLLAVGLIAVRGKLFHRRVRPMLCNLLLAWVPMVLVMVLDVTSVASARPSPTRWRSAPSPLASTSSSRSRCSSDAYGRVGGAPPHGHLAESAWHRADEAAAARALAARTPPRLAVRRDECHLELSRSLTSPPEGLGDLLGRRDGWALTEDARPGGRVASRAPWLRKVDRHPPVEGCTRAT
jgi:hypothetical protein